jgi:hypothetical protein
MRVKLIGVSDKTRKSESGGNRALRGKVACEGLISADNRLHFDAEYRLRAMAALQINDSSRGDETDP